MEKRLFLAIDLPIAFRQALAEQQRIIKRQNIKKFTAKWTPIENLHVTVLFLGNIKADNLNDLEGRLREQLAKIPFFQLVPTNIGFAPPGKALVRMIWLYFSISQAYIKAVEACRLAAADYMSEKVKQKIKTPRPHITLARLFKPVRNSQWQKKLAGNWNWQVRDISLWESQLGGRQPVYRRLAVFKLKQ